MSRSQLMTVANLCRVAVDIPLPSLTEITVVWIIAILCLPRTLQGSGISKIIWHALSLVLLDFPISPQP